MQTLNSKSQPQLLLRRGGALRGQRVAICDDGDCYDGDLTLVTIVTMEAWHMPCVWGRMQRVDADLMRYRREKVTPTGPPRGKKQRQQVCVPREEVGVGRGYVSRALSHPPTPTPPPLSLGRSLRRSLHLSRGVGIWVWVVLPCVCCKDTTFAKACSTARARHL